MSRYLGYSGQNWGQRAIASVMKEDVLKEGREKTRWERKKTQEEMRRNKKSSKEARQEDTIKGEKGAENKTKQNKC